MRNNRCSVNGKMDGIDIPLRLFLLMGIFALISYDSISYDSIDHLAVKPRRKGQKTDRFPVTFRCAYTHLLSNTR
ncbi:MAG: hypothetical protein ACRC6F_12000 [Aeromonas sp.]